MISESFTIEAESLDSLAEHIISKYPECSANATASGEQMLFVIEILYQRVNANAVGVILVDHSGANKYRVSLYAGGGRRGVLQFDYGAEKHFFNEMKALFITSIL